MRLTPTEMDRLVVFAAAELARKRRARGLRLNHPEALALICDEMHEAARAGASYAEVEHLATTILTADDVLDGVAELIPVVVIECQFSDGARVLRVAQPIPAGAAGIRPGETRTAAEPVALAAGRRRGRLTVHNRSDHTIFIGSHFPFFEANRRLEFDRAKAWGMRLDLPAGDAERWLPGETKSVTLVAFGGRGVVRGFNGLSEGATTEARLGAALQRVESGGYRSQPAHQESG